MRVFRIAVPTQQHDAARSFYESVLGMPADDTVPSRLYFHCGDVILALIDWTVEGYGDFRPTPDNLYFAVDDLDAVHARAKAAGARIDAPIADRPWGERSFYCRDLDGNRLCFVDDATLFLGHGAEWS
jgi:catechol 2,3-dioxygenase-like lactoylglutathione lyase family enzyme